MPIDSWDEERIAALKQMWAEGHSATRIGLALDFSRGAVMGKISRLKLPPPPSKLPVIIDRTYLRLASVEEQRRRKREYDRKRWARLRQELQTKREEREQLLLRGTSPYSPVYRNKLPPLPEMSKGQLRAMLAQAMQNTAAL